MRERLSSAPMTAETLHGVEFGWFGSLVRVRSDREALVRVVNRLWGASPVPATPERVRDYAARFASGDPPRLTGPGGTWLLDARVAEWHAYNLVVDDLTGSVGDHFLVHAASLRRGGDALLIAGPSGFGKTTLALHLALRGFSLYGDDIAAIERSSGLLIPFPRSVHLRAGSRATLGPAQLRALSSSIRDVTDEGWTISPASLRHDGDAPCRVAVVALLRSPGEGAQVPAPAVHDLWMTDGHGEEIDDLARLSGVVRVVRTKDDPTAARVETDDPAPFTRWMEEHRRAIVAAIPVPRGEPEFGAAPRMVPIGGFQAALEICQALVNRHEGSLLAREFGGHETLLAVEVADALREARCFALWPGRLEETVDLLVAATSAES